MNKEINSRNRTRLSEIRDELFNIANSYAGDEHGHIACRLHGISNSVYNIRDVMEVLYPLENTSSESQHGREPKPLAQYLADYLETETRRSVDVGESWLQTQTQEWLEQALDAYESTENVVIQIIKKKAR